MTQQLPRTRATTADGYLSFICKLALDEPKRMDMGVILVRGTGLDRYMESQRLLDVLDGQRVGRRVVRRALRPACNTVGCVAGWTIALAGLSESNTHEMAYTTQQARELLGLDKWQAHELFYPTNGLMDAPNKQSKAHALATVKHIRAFQRKYKAQLKAKKIERG